VAEYQDRIIERRKQAAARSRQRDNRKPGDLIKTRRRCEECGQWYYAAFGGCQCGGSEYRGATGDTAA
jgi:hypothetical protein